jgi:hypothetical protein
MSKIDITKPIIFMRIAWMEHYKGITPTDIPKGAGSYVDENGHGGEVHNFLKKGNYFYGFVRVSKDGNINLKKLGAEREAKILDGVNIVFFSKDPEFGSQYIVGCYKNARIYKTVQTFHLSNGRKRYYNSRCKAGDEILIPTELRNKSIEGPGQSNLFYAKEHLTKKQLQEIVDFIENPKDNKIKKESTARKSSGRGWAMDAELKKEIEVSAMDFTAAYFERKGFEIIDVHKENKGWDLEAVKGKKIFHLEVKGTQNAFGAVLLTPNEYTHFKSKKSTFRLCVVYHALDAKKTAIDIIYHDGKRWVNSTGNDINRKEAVSAMISIKK